MNIKNIQIEEVLRLLQIKEETKKRFLSAVYKFKQEDQKNILDFLINQLEDFYSLQKAELQRIKKIYKKGTTIIEENEKNTSSKNLEHALSLLT